MQSVFRLHHKKLADCIDMCHPSMHGMTYEGHGPVCRDLITWQQDHDNNGLFIQYLATAQDQNYELTPYRMYNAGVQNHLSFIFSY
jgi:hypothetical protein